LLLRVGLICSSLVALAAAATRSAHAEDARSTVLLVDPGSAPLTHRLREEIEALGLDVTVVPDGHPREPLEARARRARAVGAIRITGSDSGSVDMTILDRATGKTVSRHLAVATPSDPASAELVATRTVELLRASLMELDAPHPPRGDAPVTADVQALAEPGFRSKAGTFAVATGPAVVVSPRLGASFDVWVALSLHADSGVGATARVLAPATGGEVQTPEGRVSTVAWQYRLGASYDGSAPSAGFAPRVEAGLALVTLATDGSTRAPFRSVRERSVTWGPWASLGLEIALARRLSVVAGADATFLLPKTVIRAAGREVAAFGRPLVGAAAGLELAW
jgi:hypothetical protein